MKINVVYAHPAADSYQASLHKRLVQVLKARGDEIVKPSLLHIRRWGVVTTCGSPWWYTRLYTQDPGRKVLLRGLKTMCGRTEKHLYLAKYSVESISSEARESFARKVERRFERF